MTKLIQFTHKALQYAIPENINILQMCYFQIDIRFFKETSIYYAIKLYLSN